jgi:hypothetical protein
VSLTVAGVHRRVTRPLPDNSWAFKDVPPGTHVLEVVADGAALDHAPAAAASALSAASQPLHAAPSTLGRPRLFCRLCRSHAPFPGFEVPVVRVDVGAEDGRVRFARADAPARSLRAPLVLGPVARVAYVIPVQPWSLRSLLANPMYLIMGLMAVMMFIMPKMMESIDPDVRNTAQYAHASTASHAWCAQELKQMQEQMGKGGTLGLLQVRVYRCRRFTACCVVSLRADAAASCLRGR